MQGESFSMDGVILTVLEMIAGFEPRCELSMSKKDLKAFSVVKGQNHECNCMGSITLASALSEPISSRRCSLHSNLHVISFLFSDDARHWHRARMRMERVTISW